MKRLYKFLPLLAVPLMFLFLGYSDGSPGSKTGSPGDGMANCTQCHSGTPQNASEWIMSTIPDLGYSSGETYTFTAMVEHAGSSRFGFEVTAEDSDGNKVGEIIITEAARTQYRNNDKSITHTFAGNAGSNNMNEWTFDWTAPDAMTGDVTFYGAFNATNSNGSTSGDVVYLSTYTVGPDVTGVDELANDFSFYPNPSNGVLNIENPDYSKTSSVLVFNSTGQLVEEFIMNSEFAILNLTNMTKGIYFVKLNAQSAKMQKLVIN
jgi:hypothetical protein